MENKVINIAEQKVFSNEAFRTLRTNLLYTENAHSIVVTSNEPDEGKTVIAYYLAQSFADLGKKTLLLDGDLKKSSLARFLGISRKTVGLSEYITDQADLVIYDTSVNNLHVLASGSAPSNSTELLSSDKFEQLLTKLKEEYDYIIFDTPPFVVANDAMIVTTKCDGAIVVVRHEYTRKKDILQLINTFKRNDARIFGTVLNRVKKRQVEYSKYYYYKYNYYDYK